MKSNLKPFGGYHGTNMNSTFRHILSSQENYFQLLYPLLDYHDDIAKPAFLLLNRLPTNFQIFADIIKLRGVRDVQNPGERDWRYVLDQRSKYKLMYSLTIVECFIAADDNACSQRKKDMLEKLWSHESDLMRYKKTWVSDFIVYGGLAQLNATYDVFASYCEDKFLQINELEIIEERKN